MSRWNQGPLLNTPHGRHSSHYRRNEEANGSRLATESPSENGRFPNHQKILPFCGFPEDNWHTEGQNFVRVKSVFLDATRFCSRVEDVRIAEAYGLIPRTKPAYQAVNREVEVSQRTSGT